MKTGKNFSQKQLLNLSGLSDRQLRTLSEYNLIESKSNSPRYDLTEVVYCRLVSLLRSEYSMQYIRELLEPCKYYGRQLITEDTAFIWLNEAKKMHTGYLETVEYQKLMDDAFVVFDRKLIFKKDGETQTVNFICINLLEIISDLFKKAIELKFDSVELKFAELLNQGSQGLTV